MNRKLILLVCLCFAVSLVAMHFRRPRISAPSAAGQLLPKISAPSLSASDSDDVPEITPTQVAAPEPAKVDMRTPATAIAEVQTNRADVNSGWAARFKLMAELRDWAGRDLDGALNYVSKMPQGDERDDALQAVCFGLAEKEPARAVTVAQTLQQPAPVMENLVQQWAGSDLPAALVWAADQPASSERDGMLQRVVLVLSQSDPANAANVAAEEIPPGPSQDEAILTLLHQWGNQDLSAAAKWVGAFPFRNSQLQERALEELEGIAHYQDDLGK